MSERGSTKLKKILLATGTKYKVNNLVSALIFQFRNLLVQDSFHRF